MIRKLSKIKVGDLCYIQLTSSQPRYYYLILTIDYGECRVLRFSDFDFFFVDKEWCLCNFYRVEPS